jgi:hypothetical protein
VQDVHDTSVKTNICAGTMLRNVGYIVLFPDIRYAALIRQLSRMYFVGDQGRLIDPFHAILSNRKQNAEQRGSKERAYLVINFLTNDPRLQITEAGLYPSGEMQLFEKKEHIKKQKMII